MGDEARRAALALARDLRRAGVRCDLSFAGGGFGKQFKAADRRGARWAVVLGEDEIRKGTVSVKDLKSGEQEEVPRDALAARLLPGAEQRR
jgi:histidyl-tRNA synthetase